MYILPSKHINTAFLVVSFYNFYTFIKDFSFSKHIYSIQGGATIRGHHNSTDTIPAHNFGINKFLHPSYISIFHLHFFLLKTQVHIYKKCHQTRIKSRFSRQQDNSLNMHSLAEIIIALHIPDLIPATLTKVLKVACECSRVAAYIDDSWRCHLKHCIEK